MALREYTYEERRKILQYLIDHQIFTGLKGNAVWKQMEKAKIVNRSWQSLRTHFKTKMLDMLHHFKISEENKMKLLQGARHKVRERRRETSVSGWIAPKHNPFSFSSDSDSAPPSPDLLLPESIAPVASISQHGCPTSAASALDVISISSDSDSDATVCCVDVHTLQASPAKRMRHDVSATPSPDLLLPGNVAAGAAWEREMHAATQVMELAPADDELHVCAVERSYVVKLDGVIQLFVPETAADCGAGAVCSLQQDHVILGANVYMVGKDMLDALHCMNEISRELQRGVTAITNKYLQEQQFDAVSMDAAMNNVKALVEHAFNLFSVQAIDGNQPDGAGTESSTPGVRDLSDNIVPSTSAAESDELADTKPSGVTIEATEADGTQEHRVTTQPQTDAVNPQQRPDDELSSVKAEPHTSDDDALPEQLSKTQTDAVNPQQRPGDELPSVKDEPHTSGDDALPEQLSKTQTDSGSTEFYSAL